MTHAGISPRGSIWEGELALWDSVVDVHLRGAYLCSRAVMPIMKANKGGRILNIGSYRGVQPTGSEGAYGPAKAGLWNLTQLLAAHLVEYNVGVNPLIPGGVQTAMNRNPSSKTTDEVMPAVMFLITQEPHVMSGQVVTLLQSTGRRPAR